MPEITFDKAYLFAKNASIEDLKKLAEDEKIHLIKFLTWKLDELKKADLNFFKKGKEVC